MPKLPDPTLFSQETPPTGGQQATPVQTAEQVPKESASVEQVRSSPFRFVGSLFIVLFIIAVGFVVTRYLILPRLKKPEMVTLTYWGLWESPQVLAPAIAKFEANNPTIKIDYQMQSKVDYRERLQSALARGEGPDIMRMHATWIPMFKNSLDPATTDAFSPAEFQQQFYQVAAKDLIQNDTVIGVPLMFDGLGLYVNNELFGQTNPAVLTNWSDLRKAAFDLTVRDSQGQITQAGIAMGTTGNIAHWPDILATLLLQNSVDLIKPDVAVDARGRNLGADALHFYTLFSTDDRIWDETLPSDVVAFENSKVVMILAPSWEAHVIRQQNPNLNFSIHPIPQLSSQKKLAWASYWVEGVSKNSKYKREAWTFLKFLSSEEALQVMYAEASKTRAFGEIYPRPGMAKSLEGAPYVDGFTHDAPHATSWYMSSSTNDNGINDEMIAYWKDAINSILAQKATPEAAIAIVAKGVQQVLGKYKVTQ